MKKEVEVPVSQEVVYCDICGEEGDVVSQILGEVEKDVHVKCAEKAIVDACKT